MRNLIVILGLFFALFAASLRCTPIIYGGGVHPAAVTRKIASPSSQGSTHGSKATTKGGSSSSMAPSSSFINTPSRPSHSSSSPSSSSSQQHVSVPNVKKILSREASLSHLAGPSSSPTSSPKAHSDESSARASRGFTFAQPQQQGLHSNGAHSAPSSPQQRAQVPIRKTQSAPTSPAHTSPGSSLPKDGITKAHKQEVRGAFLAAQARVDDLNAKLTAKNRSPLVSKVMRNIPGTAENKLRKAEIDREGKWLRHYRLD